MSSFSVQSDGFALGLQERTVDGQEELAQAVLRLFDLMHLRLLRYSVSFGLSIADGEDIVQETFLALFEHLKRGRARDNLQGWLFKVTHNLALKKRAKRGREVADGLAVEEAESLDPSPTPEEWLLLRERHHRMQSVLRALPMADQLCLRLRAEGLPYREIAQVIGVSLGSVSASLSRSLARLQAVDRR